jgi:hypothetical protein
MIFALWSRNVVDLASEIEKQFRRVVEEKQ